MVMMVVPLKMLRVLLIGSHQGTCGVSQGVGAGSATGNESLDLLRKKQDERERNELANGNQGGKGQEKESG